MTALLLTVQTSALAQNSVDYKFSGVFTWGKIISMLCDGGWCRTALPREFYSLEVPVSIYETSFENAFKALKMQALADGYVLTKTGAEKPYNVSVRPKTDDESAYISCTDSTVHLVPAKYLQSYIRADSLKCRGMVTNTRDSLWWEDSLRVVPLDRFRINFYVVSSMYLDEYGIDWTTLWATGNLWKTPHLISDWALRAVASGDTLSEFRTIEIDIDSAASLHWGSQLKEEKSTYQTGETVRTDYEYHDFGLTLDLSRSVKGGIRGEYKLAQRDDLNSIIEGNFGGGGSDSVSTFGVYDAYTYTEKGVPFISSVPLLGNLFSIKKREKVKSFFVIEIVQLKKIVANPARWHALNELKELELDYADSSYIERDTLVDTQDKEVVNVEPN